MPYLSKTTERVVAATVSAHMSEYNLCHCNQSMYKTNYSVEMALVCVQNEILRAMDNQNIVVMMLLDLSAAFDTVDHNLENQLVAWIVDFLLCRNQCDFVNGKYSDIRLKHAGSPWVVVSHTFYMSCLIPNLDGMTRLVSLSRHVSRAVPAPTSC